MYGWSNSIDTESILYYILDPWKDINSNPIYLNWERSRILTTSQIFRDPSPGSICWILIIIDRGAMWIRIFLIPRMIKQRHVHSFSDVNSSHRGGSHDDLVERKNKIIIKDGGLDDLLENKCIPKREK